MTEGTFETAFDRSTQAKLRAGIFSRWNRAANPNNCSSSDAFSTPARASPGEQCRHRDGRASEKCCEKNPGRQEQCTEKHAVDGEGLFRRVDLAVVRELLAMEPP